MSTRNMRRPTPRMTRKLSLGLLLLLASFPSLSSGQERPEDIFPGQVDPRLISLMIEAKDLALRREYQQTMKVCDRLDREFPDNPAGPTAKVVLYQVMMLENDDYAYDAQLRREAARVQQRMEIFLEHAPKNSWYYTLAGASWGIQGIYFLRRDEYFRALPLGLKGLYYMQTAAKMDPQNWEARMGIGLFLYYRSAYARYLPIPWLDQRERGLAEVRAAGQNREYLREIARIAEYYILLNEGQYDQAREIMDELIRARPQMVVFYQLAGRAMFEKGDYRAALDYYQRQGEIDDSLYLPFFRLGECYYQLGEYDKAKENFSEFKKRVGERRNDYLPRAERYLRELN